MIRRSALILASLALVASVPALAQTPFACRIGPYAKSTHMIAESFDTVVIAEPGVVARTEYRMMVRNPHPWPAAVLTGIQMEGIIEAPAEPTAVPPRGSAHVVIGSFLLVDPLVRNLPMLDDVRAAMTIPLCEVMRPESEHPPAAGVPSASAPPFPPRAVTINRAGASGSGGWSQHRYRL